MKLKAKDLLMREFIVHNCENFNDYTETSGMLAMRKYDLTPDEVRDEIENIKGLHKPGTFLDEDELDMLFRNEYKNEQATSLDDFIMNASMDSINRIGEYGMPYHYAQHTLQYIDERMEGEKAKSFVNHFIEVGATGFDDYIETTGYYSLRGWDVSQFEVANMIDDMHEYQYLQYMRPQINMLIQTNPSSTDVLRRELKQVESRIEKLNDRYDFEGAFNERDFVDAVEEASGQQLTL